MTSSNSLDFSFTDMVRMHNNDASIKKMEAGETNWTFPSFVLSFGIFFGTLSRLKFKNSVEGRGVLVGRHCDVQQFIGFHVRRHGAHARE